jgi:hypothetical protein
MAVRQETEDTDMDPSVLIFIADVQQELLPGAERQHAANTGAADEIPSRSVVNQTAR